MIPLLIGYMWLFVHRPFEVWPVLAAIRLERVYMIVTLLAWLTSGRVHWRCGALGMAYLAFSAGLVLCWLASPWSGNPNCRTVVEDYLKVLVFSLVLVTSVRDERELKVLVLGFLGALALYMTHSLWEYRNGRHVYRMGVARMVGVNTMLGDPNSFAASLVYALPLVLVLGTIVPGFKGRLLTLGYTGLSVTCVFLTGSRSALVGLLAWCLLLGLRARKKLLGIVLLAVLAPVVWSMLPTDHQKRFSTLIDPSVGPASAQASAESRSEGFRLGRKLFEQDPMTGCGPGAWIPATGSRVESHNLYGQVMGELGLIGVLTFAAIVGLMAGNALNIRAICRDHPPEAEADFLRALAVAIGQALILLLILGWGGHNLYRFNWLWYGAFLILARELAALRPDTTFDDDEDEDEDGIAPANPTPSTFDPLHGPDPLVR